MFHLFAKYKYDIPKLLFQVEFKQILNDWINLLFALHFTLVQVQKKKKKKTLEECAAVICLLLTLSNTFVYIVKKYLNETKDSFNV